MKFTYTLKNLVFASALILSVSLFQSCKDKNEETTKVIDSTNTADQNKEVPEKTNANSTGDVVAKDLNPVHGQPGHRCDIAVGAPLNSAVRDDETTSPLLLESSTDNGGINPAHGQSGHRCDIEVGARLPNG